MEKNITCLCDKQKATDQKMKKKIVATEVPVFMMVLFIETE